MDQNQHGQPGRGIGSAPAQDGHDKNQYQSYPMMLPSTNPPTQTVGPSAFSPYPGENHYALQYMHRQQQQQEQLKEKVKNFWANQLQQIKENTDVRTHSVPLSRIKKIMKSDADVKLVAAETPVLFAKACELFIMELTLKAWANAEDNQRRILKKIDVASAISRTEVFDFLEDICPIPKDDTNKIIHQLTPTENVPYSYMPPPQHVASLPPPFAAPTTPVANPPPPFAAPTALVANPPPPFAAPTTLVANPPPPFLAPATLLASPPPPFAAPTTLHQIPHGLQTYPMIPTPRGPIPNQQNPSPNSDD